ncbi:hypothetical protein LMG28138_05702 [Pararobbsia alpina]|uniref:Secreted protein n=1 Tax=Pararobbsia alpina TaxID=621374 RepID=A0A6S7BMV2_9BURK|nr:hypothetical protein LMG28138_05702 [Pararobbsia alpina]
MKTFWIKTAAVLYMLVASCVASAASELTPAECNDYPFQAIEQKQVTHALSRQNRALSSEIPTQWCVNDRCIDSSTTTGLWPLTRLHVRRSCGCQLRQRSSSARSRRTRRR